MTLPKLDGVSRLWYGAALLIAVAVPTLRALRSPYLVYAMAFTSIYIAASAAAAIYFGLAAWRSRRPSKHYRYRADGTPEEIL